MSAVIMPLDAQAAWVKGDESPEYRKRRYETNAQTIANAIQRGGLRLDSASVASTGYFLARELEQKLNIVLQEKYEDLNLINLFPRLPGIAPGAEEYSVEDKSYSGDAEIYNGSSRTIPTVGARRGEKSRRVHNFVTSMRWDYFDEERAAFANQPLRADLMFAARRAIAQLHNKLLLQGDDDIGFEGILNGRSPKRVSTVAYNSGTSADTMLADLHGHANFAALRTKRVFTPNAMIISQNLDLVISQKQRSVASDITVKQAFLQDNPFVQRIVVVPEFDGAGPGGEDLMFFCRLGDQRSAAIAVAKPFSMLPLDVDLFERRIPCYARFGDLVQFEPLNNLLVYADADAS